MSGFVDEGVAADLGDDKEDGEFEVHDGVCEVDHVLGLVDGDGVVDGEGDEEDDDEKDGEGDAEDGDGAGADEDAREIDDVPLGVSPEGEDDEDGDEDREGDGGGCRGGS